MSTTCRYLRLDLLKLINRWTRLQANVPVHKTARAAGEATVGDEESDFRRESSPQRLLLVMPSISLLPWSATRSFKRNDDRVADSNSALRIVCTASSSFREDPSGSR